MSREYEKFQADQLGKLSGELIQARRQGSITDEKLEEIKAQASGDNPSLVQKLLFDVIPDSLGATERRKPDAYMSGGVLESAADVVSMGSYIAGSITSAMTEKLKADVMPWEDGYIDNLGTSIGERIYAMKGLLPIPFTGLYNPWEAIGGAIGFPTGEFANALKSRTDYTHFADRNDLFGESQVANTVGGVALDIALDPTTYLSFGLAPGIKYGPRVATRYGAKLFNMQMQDMLPDLVAKSGSRVGLAEEFSDEIWEAVIANHDELAKRLSANRANVISDTLAKSKLTGAARIAISSMNAIGSARGAVSPLIYTVDDLFVDTAKAGRDYGIKPLAKPIAESLAGKSQTFNVLPSINIGGDTRGLVAKFFDSFSKGWDAPPEVNEARRFTAQVTAEKINQKKSEINAWAKAFTDQEREAIADIVENREASKWFDVSQYDIRLHEAADWAKRQLDEIYEAESEAGYPIDRVSEYVTRVYASSPEVRRIVEGVASGNGEVSLTSSNRFTHSRVIASIVDGSEPFAKGSLERDIAKIVGWRHRASIEMIERDKLFKSVLQSHSLPVAIIAARDNAGHNGIIAGMMRRFGTISSKILAVDEVWEDTFPAFKDVGFKRGDAAHTSKVLAYLEMPLNERLSDAGRIIRQELGLPETAEWFVPRKPKQAEVHGVDFEAYIPSEITPGITLKLDIPGGEKQERFFDAKDVIEALISKNTDFFEEVLTTYKINEKPDIGALASLLVKTERYLLDSAGVPVAALAGEDKLLNIAGWIKQRFKDIDDDDIKKLTDFINESRSERTYTKRVNTVPQFMIDISRQAFKQAGIVTRTTSPSVESMDSLRSMAISLGFDRDNFARYVRSVIGEDVKDLTQHHVDIMRDVFDSLLSSPEMLEQIAKTSKFGEGSLVQSLYEDSKAVAAWIGRFSLKNLDSWKAEKVFQSLPGWMDRNVARKMLRVKWRSGREDYALRVVHVNRQTGGMYHEVFSPDLAIRAADGGVESVDDILEIAKLEPVMNADAYEEMMSVYAYRRDIERRLESVRRARESLSSVRARPGIKANDKKLADELVELRAKYKDETNPTVRAALQARADELLREANIVGVKNLLDSAFSPPFSQPGFAKEAGRIEIARKILGTDLPENASELTIKRIAKARLYEMNKAARAERIELAKLKARRAAASTRSGVAGAVYRAKRKELFGKAGIKTNDRGPKYVAYRSELASEAALDRIENLQARLEALEADIAVTTANRAVERAALKALFNAKSVEDYRVAERLFSYTTKTPEVSFPSPSVEPAGFADDVAEEVVEEVAEEVVEEAAPTLSKEERLAKYSADRAAAEEARLAAASEERAARGAEIEAGRSEYKSARDSAETERVAAAAVRSTDGEERALKYSVARKATEEERKAAAAAAREAKAATAANKRAEYLKAAQQIEDERKAAKAAADREAALRWNEERKARAEARAKSEEEARAKREASKVKDEAREAKTEDVADGEDEVVRIGNDLKTDRMRSNLKSNIEDYFVDDYKRGPIDDFDYRADNSRHIVSDAEGIASSIEAEKVDRKKLSKAAGGIAAKARPSVKKPTKAQIDEMVKKIREERAAAEEAELKKKRKKKPTKAEIAAAEEAARLEAEAAAKPKKKPTKAEVEAEKAAKAEKDKIEADALARDRAEAEARIAADYENALDTEIEDEVEKYISDYSNIEDVADEAKAAIAAMHRMIWGKGGLIEKANESGSRVFIEDSEEAARTFASAGRETLSSPLRLVRANGREVYRPSGPLADNLKYVEFDDGEDIVEMFRDIASGIDEGISEAIDDIADADFGEPAVDSWRKLRELAESYTSGKVEPKLNLNFSGSSERASKAADEVLSGVGRRLTEDEYEDISAFFGKAYSDGMPIKEISAKVRAMIHGDENVAEGRSSTDKLRDAYYGIAGNERNKSFDLLMDELVRIERGSNDGYMFVKRAVEELVRRQRGNPEPAFNRRDINKMIADFSLSKKLGRKLNIKETVEERIARREADRAVKSAEHAATEAERVETVPPRKNLTKEEQAERSARNIGEHADRLDAEAAERLAERGERDLRAKQKHRIYLNDRAYEEDRRKLSVKSRKALLERAKERYFAERAAKEEARLAAVEAEKSAGAGKVEAYRADRAEAEAKRATDAAASREAKQEASKSRIAERADARAADEAERAKSTERAKAEKKAKTLEMKRDAVRRKAAEILAKDGARKKSIEAAASKKGVAKSANEARKAEEAASKEATAAKSAAKSEANKARFAEESAAKEAKRKAGKKKKAEATPPEVGPSKSGFTAADMDVIEEQAKRISEASKSLRELKRDLAYAKKMSTRRYSHTKPDVGQTAFDLADKLAELEAMFLSTTDKAEKHRLKLAISGLKSMIGDFRSPDLEDDEIYLKIAAAIKNIEEAGDADSLEMRKALNAAIAERKAQIQELARKTLTAGRPSFDYKSKMGWGNYLISRDEALASREKLLAAEMEVGNDIVKETRSKYVKAGRKQEEGLGGGIENVGRVFETQTPALLLKRARENYNAAVRDGSPDAEGLKRVYLARLSEFAESSKEYDGIDAKLKSAREAYNAAVRDGSPDAGDLKRVYLARLSEFAESSKGYAGIDGKGYKVLPEKTVSMKVFLPESVALSLDELSESSMPKWATGGMRSLIVAYDKLMGMYRQNVLAPHPAYWGNNIIGNVAMSVASAGGMILNPHNDFEVMRSMGSVVRYAMIKGGAGYAVGQHASREAALSSIGKQEFFGATVEQLYNEMHVRGILRGQISDDIMGKAIMGTSWYTRLSGASIGAGVGGVAGATAGAPVDAGTDTTYAGDAMSLFGTVAGAWLGSRNLAKMRGAPVPTTGGKADALVNVNKAASELQSGMPTVLKHGELLTEAPMRVAMFLAEYARTGSPYRAQMKTFDVLNDWSGLSSFEKTYMQRVFPFYNWMKFATKASITHGYGQAKLASYADKVSGDRQDRPDWFDTKVSLVFRTDESVIIARGLGLPIEDTAAISEAILLNKSGSEDAVDFTSTILGRTTPLVRHPLEVMMNVDSMTGEDIFGGGRGMVQTPTDDDAMWESAPSWIRIIVGYKPGTKDERARVNPALAYALKSIPPGRFIAEMSRVRKVRDENEARLKRDEPGVDLDIAGTVRNILGPAYYVRDRMSNRIMVNEKRVAILSAALNEAGRVRQSTVIRDINRNDADRRSRLVKPYR
jgi:hypothetical protein